MKKALLGLVAVTALIFSACSKDDDDGSQEKMILGKWSQEYVKQKVTDKVNGGSTTTDQPIYPGDYLDFRGDGKLYTYISDPNEGPGYDAHDTVPYKLANNYLIIDGDSMAINTLNKSSLVFTITESSSTRLYETTWALKK